MPAAELFRVVIRDLRPQTILQEEKLRVVEAVRFFEDAFKSNFFKEKILGFGNRPTGFILNLGMNNEQVYNCLLNAAEVQGNIERQVADLHLTIILGNSPDGRTIGFVNNNSKIIHTYQQFLSPQNLKMERLSAHFAHEWSHLLGFRHPIDTGANGAFLSQTIPYAVEKIVEEYVAMRVQDFMLDVINP